MSKTDTEKRYKKLIELESTYELHTLKFKGVYSVWGAFRVYFDYHDLMHRRIFDAPVEGIKISYRTIKNYLKLLLRFNFIHLFIRRRDYVVLESGRSQDGIDIYTQSIRERLGSDGLYLSFSQQFRHLRDQTIYLDTYKIISKMLAKLFSKAVNERKFENFKQFLRAFGASPHLLKTYKAYYVEFIVMYYFYILLLRFHKPKMVFTVVSYENGALIAAADSLGIETYEIQHGIIYRYHLGYNYFDNAAHYKSILPKNFLTFSAYWRNNLYLPPGINVLPLGNDYLSINASDIKKTPNSIVFVSQGVLGAKLADFLVQNFSALDEYTIYFKLHPNEFELVHTKYQALAAIANKHNNLSIIKSEYSIQQLQDICEFQVGVFSTAVYEGLQRRCKTILLLIDGIEGAEDLIGQKLVETMQKSELLRPKLDHFSTKECETVFFDALQEDVLDRLLERTR